MKKKFLFAIIVSFILVANGGFAQTSISGVINFYTAVDSIYPSKDTIEVANPADFHANDTVMIYQVKGATPKTDTLDNEHNFGNPGKDDFHSAGKYEIILIQKVLGNQIIFKAFLSNDYDTDDLVQMISVPSYKSVTVDDELSCAPWDTLNGFGGVLALMASDTLFLNADINVTGKGFCGAEPFYYDYDSYGSNCASEDSALYEAYYFTEKTNAISAGRKGEGIAMYDTTYSKGLGRWANGGGGGNARFSGGGGGSNGGLGGDGGDEDTVFCKASPNYEGDYWTGLGGRQGFNLNLILSDFEAINDSTIYFGGGGGSGTYVTGKTASNGGNGGGIVILIARVIKSNNNSIIADGESVSGVVSASGGGGGGGGTIVFDAEEVVGDVIINTIGGVGGWVEKLGESGPGGGGSGGVIFWNSVEPSGVKSDYNGGEAGFVEEFYLDEERYNANPGKFGTEKINYKAPLTGFLYNWISDDQVVCDNIIPNLIIGTEPRGGNGSGPDYEWYQSPNGNDSWALITDSIRKDFQPAILSETTYYQRVVTWGGVTDKGNVVEVLVQEAITGNEIFMPQDSVICIGNEVDTVKGTELFPGNGGDNLSYKYFWDYSFDNSIWVTETGTEDTLYNHGIITDTTYVRRRVISGACRDTASLYNPIIGLPQISNNVMPSDQEICKWQIPEEIIPEEVEGGLGVGTYNYIWEQSANSSDWNVITDSIRENLAPSNLSETTYYRRTVISDDCEHISDTIKVNVLPLIENDHIITSSLIFTCYDTEPQLIDGSTPTGGNASYTYEWKKSTDGLSWTSLPDSDVEDYQSEALTVKTYFKRYVISGEGGCCESNTDSIIVDIHPLPIARLLPTDIDTSCSSDPAVLDFRFRSGNKPFTLTYNNGYTNFTPSNINDTIYTPTVNPETTQESLDYTYSIVSVVDKNGCEATDIDGSHVITVYGWPIADPGDPDEVCTLSYQLAATETFENAKGIWSQYSSIGNTDFHNQETEALANITVDTALVYTYKWKETNWECSDSAYVDITMYKRPYNIGVIRPTDKEGDVDSTIRFIDELQLIAHFDNFDGFNNRIDKYWSVFSGSAEPSNVINDTVTYTELNDLGGDYIEFQWFIDKGVCADTTIIRRIKLDEIFTPTGFTPNGDLVNDFALFKGLENADEHEVIIFNRWGTEVFRANNFSNEVGWDGKNNDGKDLPEDTYFYILTVTDDGVTQTHKGYIVLKRY